MKNKNRVYCYIILTVVSWLYPDKLNIILHNHHYLPNMDDQVLKKEEKYNVHNKQGKKV